MKPAIVCATHVIGLAVIRALGAKRVPIYALYYDPMDMGYVSRFVTRAIRVAHPHDREEEFIRAILSLDASATGGVVIPADDFTVTAISRHKKRLQQRFTVASADASTTELFIDKNKTYQLAGRLGIRSPQTHMVRTRDEALARGLPILPCLVKPCRSHLYFEKFRRKMTLVNNESELLSAFDAAHAANLEVLIQEYIPGDDSRGVNYNSYCIDGEPVAEFTAEKIRLSPPGFGVPSAVRVKAIPKISGYGRTILKSLRYEGFSCIEFKHDARSDDYAFMEVNCRHNRSGLLALRCGINFPWIQYSHLVLAGNPRETGTCDDNRIWIDEFKDVPASVPRLLKGHLSLRDFLNPYLNRHVFAVFDPSDPAPFFKRLISVVRFLA